MTVAPSRTAVDVRERIYTVADIAAMPSELPSGPARFELDNGRLITMVPPGDLHGSIEANLTAILHRAAAGQHGKVRCGEVGIVLWRNPDRVVGADVAFIAKESLPIRTSPEGYLETIPDLVVEVTSKNDTKAYIDRKTADYLQAGVKQVWIADSEKKTLTIHSAGKKLQTFSRGDVIRMDDFIPGFEFSVSEAFAE